MTSKTRTCSIEGCSGFHKARGYCQYHYDHFKKWGDPLMVKPMGLHMADHPSWKGDDIKYEAMHRRLNRARGMARGFACAGCGGPAAHWAYDHADPNERVGPHPYSTDLAHYLPMCAKCHTALDNPATSSRPDPRALEYFNEYWATRRLPAEGQEAELLALADLDGQWLNYLAAHDPAAFAKLPV